MQTLTSVTARPRSQRLITGAVALAWLGMYIHNVADLPGLTLASPENSVPGIVWLILLGIWLFVPARSWPTVLLLAWGTLNLVGGFATVLPMPVLPFRPEQTIHHYAFHVVYAIAQLPLLRLAWMEHRRSDAPGIN